MRHFHQYLPFILAVEDSQRGYYLLTYKLKRMVPQLYNIHAKYIISYGNYLIIKAFVFFNFYSPMFHHDASSLYTCYLIFVFLMPYLCALSCCGRTNWPHHYFSSFYCKQNLLWCLLCSPKKQSLPSLFRASECAAGYVTCSGSQLQRSDFSQYRTCYGIDSQQRNHLLFCCFVYQLCRSQIPQKWEYF